MQTPLLNEEDYTREGILEDTGIILPDDPMVPNTDCTCLCLHHQSLF
jgi:hypothetical protein